MDFGSRLTIIRDLTRANQHAPAITLLAKESTVAKGDVPSSYTPIVKAMQNMLDAEKKNSMK